MLKQNRESYLTTPEAAEILGVAAGTVRAQVSRGNLSAQKIGRDNYIAQSEIERYQREKPSQGSAPGERRRANYDKKAT